MNTLPPVLLPKKSNQVWSSVQAQMLICKKQREGRGIHNHQNSDCGEIYSKMTRVLYSQIVRERKKLKEK